MSVFNKSLLHALNALIEINREECCKCKHPDKYAKYQINTCKHFYCAECINLSNKCAACDQIYGVFDIILDQDGLEIYENYVKEKTDMTNSYISLLETNMEFDVDTLSVNFELEVQRYVDSGLTREYSLSCHCEDIWQVYLKPEPHKWANRKWIYDNTTYLFMACENSEAPLVRTLIYYGADVNAVTDFGLSPLHIAVTRGNIPIVKVLLKAGALVNSTNKYLATPLHIAAFYNYLKLVKLLIKYGANYRRICAFTCTPFGLTCQKGKRIMRNTKPMYHVCKNVLQETCFNFVILLYHGTEAEYLLETFGEMEHFEVYSKIHKDVTHVIIDSPKKLVELSYEFLLALLYRIPVVTYEWLISCQLYNSVQDYTEYYVIGTPEYPWHVVAISQIARLCQLKRVFEGFKVYVRPNRLLKFKMNDFYLRSNELMHLLRVGGAKILKKNPLCNKKPFKKCNRNYIKAIIYPPSNYIEPSNAIKYLGRGIWFLPVHWVVISILKQKPLPLLKHEF